MPTYDVPGVYIEEVTGPGVITGVGTSTAAFIGPALRGPLRVPVKISSYDDFLLNYAVLYPDGSRWPYITSPRWFYLAHGVRKFYENGGAQAYIVRVGTAQNTTWNVSNQNGEVVFILQAQQEGPAGDNINIAVNAVNYTGGTALPLANPVATVTNANGTQLTVNDASGFQKGDTITDGTAIATITDIQPGNVITTSVALAGTSLRIADLGPGPNTFPFRMQDTTGLVPGTVAQIQGYTASNNPVSPQSVVIQSVDSSSKRVTLAASPPITNTYSFAATNPPVLVPAGGPVANPTATVQKADNLKLTVSDASGFRVGDTITDGTGAIATITNIQPGNVVWTSVKLTGTNLRIADIGPPPNTFPFRMQNTKGLFPGTVAQIQGYDASNNLVPSQYVVIQSVDQAGFVTLAGTPGLTNTYSLAATNPPALVSQEFQIVITPPQPAAAETWPSAPAGAGLSLSPLHPEYVFSVVQSNYVNVLPPSVPPTASGYPAALVNASGALSIATHGVADDPTALTPDDYDAALDLLRDVEDVNLLCIPDAGGYKQLTAVTIQQDMIQHCTLKGDRFAILDSLQGAPQTGPGSVSDQRASLQAPNGFAALYYPWLTIVDPTWKPSPTNATPATMTIPPSGAMAGVYARVDNAPGGGVHKAPANTYVAGVVGLEARLSDRQQGPLNLAGIDVLRIFPGTAQVTVWGARTTGDPNITDWIYVNVRRLMIYIEQSIEQGIRWAVFEPNALPLWQKLKRTLNEFLTRVWRDGALFGATADQAFYVRIDEALNPPSTRALGRLYIEIGVAPVRPAEFIIVRIGLFDGGAQVTES
jgi:phage tail sheath protein FI